MSPTRVSSRLAKHEQQKMLRQTLTYGVGAVILGLTFIFIILPYSIRFITGVTNGDQIPTEDDSLPPQVPILSAPPVATTSATIAVTGYGQAQTDVILVVNGSQQDSKPVADDGTFSFEAQLSEGENTIAAFSKSKSEKESELSQAYTVVMDTQPPTLEIAQPTDGQSIELRRNQNTTISGKTDPGSTVTVNGRMIYAQTDGSFSSQYQLNEGENTLDFIAIDKAGNETKKSLKVTFRL